MSEVGDTITYKVVVKNDSNENYGLVKNSLSISSDYVDYTLESSDNSNVIKPKSNKMFYLIIKYNNKVPDDQFRSGTYNDNKSMIVQLSTNNTEINSLKNPNT